MQTFLGVIAAHDLAAVRHALAADNTLARSADASGSTALMHSAYSGSLEIMDALLDAGADLKATNRRNASALHWAISDPAKMKRLLQKGADVNAKTVDGRTPLHAAAQLPMGAAAVALLLESGADVNARTIVGMTPLFTAVAASAENTRLLLDKGADPNTVSQTGATPGIEPWPLVPFATTRSPRGTFSVVATPCRGGARGRSGQAPTGPGLITRVPFAFETPLMPSIVRRLKIGIPTVNSCICVRR